MDPNKLNNMIAGQGDEALAALNAMDDFCFEDDRQCTPMAQAIRSDNMQALEVMLRSKEAIEYFPGLEAETRRVVSQQAGFHSSEEIEKTETYIGSSVGGLDNFERTPLLEACRYGNRDALRLLINAGAKLNARDVLKNSTLELCLYNGLDFTNIFMDCCIDNSSKFSVDDYLLGALCGEPECYEKAVSHGRLTKKAQHFHFSMACALVDTAEVTRQLDGGYKLTDKRPYEYDPLLESVSSSMLHTYDHAQKLILAAPIVRAVEDPKAIVALSSVPVEDINAAIDKTSNADTDGEQGDADLIARIEQALPQDIDPRLQPEELVERRLELIDMLIERGLNLKGSIPKDPFPLLDQLIYTNEPRLLAKLLDVGVTFDATELESNDSIQSAIQYRCFSMVGPLRELGCPVPEKDSHWQLPCEQYQAWCRIKGTESVFDGYAPRDPKGAAATPPVVDLEPGCKAIGRSPHTWETVGESMLAAALVTDEDRSVVRLTYSNLYGPVDGVDLKVRLGDPAEPTPEDGAESANDWLQAALVEEIVDDDGDILLRSQVEEFDGETPWYATFEVSLEIAAGKRLIEICVQSPAEGILEPVVINDWLLTI